MAKETVLVTGVSGYVGGHIALQLPQNHYGVAGSVRNTSKADAVQAAVLGAGGDFSHLLIVQLDLLDDTG